VRRCGGSPVGTGRYVWEVVLATHRKPEWQAPVRVLWGRMRDGASVWHVLAPACPAAGVERAEPTLDDVYLWLRWRETEPGAHLRGPASTLSIPFPS
jgi:hypothetical protein